MQVRREEWSRRAIDHTSEIRNHDRKKGRKRKGERERESEREVKILRDFELQLALWKLLNKLVSSCGFIPLQSCKYLYTCISFLLSN